MSFIDEQSRLMQRCIAGLAVLLFATPMALADDDPEQLEQEMLAAYQQYNELFQSGQYELAITPATTALKRSLALDDTPNKTTATLYYNHALAHLGSGMRNRAIKSLDAANEMYEALGSEFDGNRIQVLMSRGDAERRLKKARPFYGQALALSERVNGASSNTHAQNLHTVGLTHLGAKEWDVAAPYLQQADAVFGAPDVEDRTAAVSSGFAVARIQAHNDVLEFDHLQRVIADFEATGRRTSDYLRLLEWSRDLTDDPALAASFTAKIEDYKAALEPEVGDYLPIKRVAPYYPRDALKKGMTGYVDLTFTVSEEGIPINIKPTGGRNYRVFAKAAIQAASKFRYEPREVDGKPVAVDGVETRLRFELKY